MPGLRRALFAFCVILAGALILAGSATRASQRFGAQLQPTSVSIEEPQGQPTTAGLFVPDPLVDPSLDLRAPPVEVPLRVIFPAYHVDMTVLGTGLVGPDSKGNYIVDAPKGPPDDPIWTKAFWYRGSGIPGDSGTSAIAGHVDDSKARPDPFFQLRSMKPGDQVIVRDTRVNKDVAFSVTSIEDLTSDQANQPQNLSRIYGQGPANGRGPLPSTDGKAHLTLLTCAGDFVNGSFNHRMVVFADRST